MVKCTFRCPADFWWCCRVCEVYAKRYGHERPEGCRGCGGLYPCD